MEGKIEKREGKDRKVRESMRKGGKWRMNREHNRKESDG